MHSIVSELWDEWSSFPPGDEETASWETAGLVAGLGGKSHDDGENCRLSSSRLWCLRRLTTLWKNSRWNRRLNIAGCMRVPASMKGRVELVVPREVCDEIGLLTGREGWDWLRGVWGSCGALYVPKSGYYLVLRIGRPDIAERVGQIMQKSRISWGERTVHGKREMILRDQQEIVTFLSKIGLTGVSLRMEDKAILRAMRDRANRMRNCDTANIKKALKTSEEQMKLALELRCSGILPTLPAHFRTLAETRLENPEATLSDLGALLSPPVTKSTVKYRWKRLSEYVNTTDE